MSAVKSQTDLSQPIIENLNALNSHVSLVLDYSGTHIHGPRTKSHIENVRPRARTLNLETIELGSNGVHVLLQSIHDIVRPSSINFGV